jgi:hypothetical protein
VRYLKMEKMAKSPNEKPNSILVLLNKKQIRKRTLLKRKNVKTKSLFL